MKFEEVPFIKPGDVIAVTAPSFGCTTEPYASRFRNAVKKLEDRGYKIRIGDTVFKSDGIGISTDPKLCAKELEEFYLDDSVDAIISAGGGEMMCTTAGYIDFEKLKNSRPKLFMGYSDNTNFIFPMSVYGIPQIYGPCIGGLGKNWEKPEIDAIDLLEGTKRVFTGYDKFQLDENSDSEDTTGFYCLTEEKVLKKYLWNEGDSVSGILCGGCLDVLATICGTKIDKSRDLSKTGKKVIWILESCDANPMEYRRQLWHLKEAGWFDNAAAFLIGRPLAGWNRELMGADMYNSVISILGETGVPVCMDCDIGHLAPMIPLMMGIDANVKVSGNELKISY